MGLLSKFIKNKSTKRTCWKCGAEIPEGRSGVSIYDIDENHPTCEDCVPSAMALALTRIARQEKRDMTIQELRTFVLLDKSKGAAKGFELIANRDANEIGGQMPGNTRRYSAFKSSELYLQFDLNCPHCAKTWTLAFAKDMYGNVNPAGSSDTSDPLDPLTQAVFFLNLKEAIDVECPHCKGAFVAMK